MRTVFSIVALCIIANAAPSAFAQPALTYTTPGAVQPGKTIELTLSGSKLDDPLQVWTSFPSTVELVPAEAGKKNPTSRKCKITLAADIAVGVGGIVVGNAAGASDALFINIDDLPSVADNGKNHSLAAAQDIKLPVAVDGVSNGNRLDHYKFSATAGQRISFEVVASRIGSAYDAVLRLLDNTGKEILYVDDDPSLGADCRFEFTFETAGDYVLEIHENQYRANSRYRLRAGDFPLVTTPFPLAAQVETSTKVEFVGPATQGASPVDAQVSTDSTGERVFVSARFPNGKSSSTATLIASRVPAAVETEPNNSTKEATAITLPCGINGVLQEKGESDFYAIDAKKGQAFLFQAISRSVGSPCIPVIQVLNADGGKVAESKVEEDDEFSLAYTFPADGTFYLVVTDLLRRGGPDYSYHISAEPNVGFSLSIKNDKTTKTRFSMPMKSGAIALDLVVARRGFNDPINLSIENAESGLQLLNPVIPAKAKAHKLIVAVPVDSTAGQLHVLRLIGNAEINGQGVSSVVETAAYVRTSKPQLTLSPAWINGLFALNTSGESPALFGLKPSSESVEFPADKGTIQFTLALERTNKEFKDPITVVLDGLPEGFAFSVKPDKDNYQVTVTGPKDAAASTHSIRANGYGALKGSGQIVSKDLELKIAAGGAK